MGKGILKVARTSKGKIFVELDRLNGRVPMPLSNVSLPDTTLDGKECEYEMNTSGQIISITIDGSQIWSQKQTPAPVNRGSADNNNTRYNDSYSLADTFLPADVRNKYLSDIDNFALKWQKAARYERGKDDEYKFLFFKNDQRKGIQFEIQANYGHLKDNFDKLYQRQRQQATQLFPNNSIEISLQLQWRMALGLGGESVYETSMTLHHLYGIPYLPSSSIKGVLRSWFITHFFAQPENVPDYEKNYPLVNAEFRAITESKLFCSIFGCPKDSKKVIFGSGKPKLKKNKKGEYEYAYDEDATISALGGEHQGLVTFFDGIPNVAPIIKTDVMNVHYKDWYKDINYIAPTDTQSPVPIFFLTISGENGLTFQTHLGAKKQITLKDIGGDYHRFLVGNLNLNADSQLLDFVKHHLTQALTQHGIGAKTAVGYGYMKE